MRVNDNDDDDDINGIRGHYVGEGFFLYVGVAIKAESHKQMRR